MMVWYPMTDVSRAFCEKLREGSPNMRPYEEVYAASASPNRQVGVSWTFVRRGPWMPEKEAGE